MSLFSMLGGAIRGALYSRKLKNCDTTEVVRSAYVKTNMILNPVRAGHNGKLPSFILIDHYLLGFIHKVAGELLYVGGLRERYLFEKALLFVVANCYEIAPSTLHDITEKMSSIEAKRFAQGSKEADGLVEKASAGDPSAFQSIFNYLHVTYDILC